jgi:hypothetical protein
VALTCTGAAVADESAANQELQAKVKALEARLAELESQTGQNWLSEQRAEEIKSLVHDVLADADTRASLLQGGMTAGYEMGKGFHVGSTDGNWSVNLNIEEQIRFIYNMQDAGATVDDDEDENRWGFENTRTKLIFSGNVVNPQWTYKVESNFAREGGSMDLEDAWIRYDYGNGWGIKGGQFRLPLTRETLVFSAHQLAVERSDTDYLYGAGFSQGIMGEYSSDQWRASAAWSDGYGGTRSSFQNSAWNTEDTEFAVTGRFEWKASGTWDQFNDFTSWAGDEQGILIGLGGHWEKGEYGSTSDDELETMQFTADVSAEFGGSNLFGAFHYRNLDNDAIVDADQIGFVVQGGLMFGDNWEAFARFEYSDLDEEGSGDNDTLTIVTFGVNKYLSGHNIKWTTDVVFAIDEVPADVFAGSDGITGLRADEADEDGQVALRTQLQLWF